MRTLAHRERAVLKAYALQSRTAEGGCKRVTYAHSRADAKNLLVIIMKKIFVLKYDEK